MTKLRAAAAAALAVAMTAVLAAAAGPAVASSECASFTFEGSLYPNPTTGPLALKVNLQVTDTDGNGHPAAVSVNIYNLQGTLVVAHPSQTVESGSGQKIDLGDVPFPAAGVYIVKAQAATNVCGTATLIRRLMVSS
jgi:hypothetical protein